MEKTKKCCHCGKVKNFKEFDKDGRHADGLYSRCIVCRNLYNRQYYKKNQEYIKKRNKDWRLTDQGRYCDARNSATSRGLAWNISLTKFVNLMKQNCFYCHLPIHKTKIGLDRLDNGLGYITTNVVTCCVLCNHVRSDLFTPYEMKKLGVIIKEIRRIRRCPQKISLNVWKKLTRQLQIKKRKKF